MVCLSLTTAINSNSLTELHATHQRHKRQHEPRDLLAAGNKGGNMLHKFQLATGPLSMLPAVSYEAVTVPWAPC